MAGTTAAIDFLAAMAEGPDRRSRLGAAFEALHARAEGLVLRLWDGLDAIGGVTRFGPGPTAERTPTVSFSARGRRPVEVCRHLASQGVFASHGDFYATTAVARLGHEADGLVRVGCACYTTEDEVDRLLRSVEEAIGR